MGLTATVHDVAFDRKLLHEHEELVLDLRPHWWFMAWPTLALVGGLIWSGRTAQKAAKEATLSPIPVIIYCFIVTLAMLWLLL